MSKSEDINTISSYLDKELSQREEQEFNQRLAADESFLALFEKLKRCDAYYQQAIAEIDKKPLPTSVQKLLATPAAEEPKPTASITSISRKRARYSTLIAQGRGIAAALAVFAMTTFLFLSGREESGESLSPALADISVDSRSLSNALNTIVAGATVELEGGDLTEVLAFSRKDGALCKQFILEQKHERLNAVACYEDNQWVTAQSDVLKKSDDTSKYYQPADGRSSPKIEEFIGSIIEGTSYSREQERTIMAQLGMGDH